MNNQSTLYRYRIATIKNSNTYELCYLDFIKNSDNQILAISNTREMVFSSHNLKEIKDHIKSMSKKLSIDFILTDIQGFGMDSMHISSNLSKADKAKVFSNYYDAYPKRVKAMFSSPSAPRAGGVFEQDMNSGGYFYYEESLNSATFSMIYAVDVVIKARAKMMLDEFLA